MALSKSAPEAVTVAQSLADHWGLTAVIIRTPQDGGPNRVELEAECWCGAPGPDRTNPTPMRMTAYEGDAAILPILDQVGAVYEQLRAEGVPRSFAQYVAMRNVLQGIKQTEGEFPPDAT